MKQSACEQRRPINQKVLSVMVSEWFKFCDEYMINSIQCP